MKGIICNDILKTLEKIMMKNTEAYRDDFEQDCKILTRAAKESPSTYLWMSRKCGTYCLPEREVFMRGTFSNVVWQYYNNEEPEQVKGYAVEVSGMEDGRVKGTLYKLDYPAHCKEVARESVRSDIRKVTYEKGDVYQPIKEYVNRVRDSKLGNYIDECVVPNDPEELELVLAIQANERHKASRRR